MDLGFLDGDDRGLEPQGTTRRGAPPGKKKRTFDSIAFDDSSIEVFSVDDSSSSDDDDEIATLHEGTLSQGSSSAIMSQLTTSPSLLETQPSTQKKSRKSSSKKKKNKQGADNNRKKLPPSSSSTELGFSFTRVPRRQPKNKVEEASIHTSTITTTKVNNSNRRQESKVEMLQDNDAKKAVTSSDPSKQTTIKSTTTVSIEPFSSEGAVLESEVIHIAAAPSKENPTKPAAATPARNKVDKSSTAKDPSIELKHAKMDAGPPPAAAVVERQSVKNKAPSDNQAITKSKSTQKKKKKATASSTDKKTTNGDTTASASNAKKPSGKNKVTAEANDVSGKSNEKPTKAKAKSSAEKIEKTKATKTKETANGKTKKKVAKKQDANAPKQATAKAKTTKTSETNKQPVDTVANKSTKRSAKSGPAEKKPPKKKPKKLNFQDQVLNHMLQAFKPFTLKTLAQELKSTENILNHLMLSLIDKRLVIKKEFTTKNNRIKELYWANHDGKAKEVNVEPPATAQEREMAKREMLELRAQDASIKQNLAQVMQIPTNQQLTEQVAKEEASLKEAQQRLEEVKARVRDAATQNSASSSGSSLATAVRSSSSAASSKSAATAATLARERCPKRLKLRINAMRTQWKTRKEKCMDFVDQVADGMEKKPKEIIKLFDLDTDEMNKAVMPPKHHAV